jgi:hypothetical protein
MKRTRPGDWDDDEEAESRGEKDTLVELNVGGRLMTTSRTTLLAVPESRLAKLVTARKNARTVTRDEAGRLFLDTDPDLFAHLLHRLRRPALLAHTPAGVDQYVWEEELRHWQVWPRDICGAVAEQYHAKHRAREEERDRFDCLLMAELVKFLDLDRLKFATHDCNPDAPLLSHQILEDACRVEGCDLVDYVLGNEAHVTSLLDRHFPRHEATLMGEEARALQDDEQAALRKRYGAFEPQKRVLVIGLATRPFGNRLHLTL